MDVTAPLGACDRAFAKFPIFGKVLLASFQIFLMTSLEVEICRYFQVSKNMVKIRSWRQSWRDGIRRTLFLAVEAIFRHPQSISRRLTGCSRRNCCKFYWDGWDNWCYPRNNVTGFGFRGLPYMTSAQEGGLNNTKNLRTNSTKNSDRGGGKKIRTFCGRHIWKPPYSFKEWNLFHILKISR